MLTGRTIESREPTPGWAGNKSIFPFLRALQNAQKKMVTTSRRQIETDIYRLLTYAARTLRCPECDPSGKCSADTGDAKLLYRSHGSACTNRCKAMTSRRRAHRGTLRCSSGRERADWHVSIAKPPRGHIGPPAYMLKSFYKLKSP